MAFWENSRWSSNIIQDFDLDFLKSGCYRLALGGEAIISSGPSDTRGAYKVLSDEKTLQLYPGNFAYLISKEVVDIPAHALGFINVDTKIKFKGLVNISGFHADPLYRGKLIFTVFNAGPSTITLSAGDRMFRLWLSDFDPPCTDLPGPGYTSIPRHWADHLHGSYPSPFALSAQVTKLETDIRRIDGQRRLVGWGIVALTALMAPFVAALYSETFGPFFHDRWQQWEAGVSYTPPPTPLAPKSDANQSTGRSPFHIKEQ